MALRVLTWNLMHGRAKPSAGRDLLADFADALSRWEWDVALLQEVPPWWPALLAERLETDQRLVLTSRNFGLPVRRAIATRWPDLIKSNGGGCNAILARRGVAAVTEQRTLRLRLAPERRWLQGVRLAGDSRQSEGQSESSGLEREVWVGNLHATVRDASAAIAEARQAARTLLEWADGAPAVLGGDFNVRTLSLAGFAYMGGADVDHVFASGLARLSEPLVLDRGDLSDHAPVAVSVG